MKSLNKVQLLGNLGADPEYKEHEGTMVSKFSLATVEERLGKSAIEKQINTQWHKVVCFNKLAEIVNKYLKKGDRIYISGKLKTSKWQDKNNENRFTTEVIADELLMLSNKPNDNS
jgi:single-strand DNA-binding protein